MRAERKPKLQVHACDSYVRVFACVCMHGGVDEGRVHIEGEAGGITARCVDEYMSTTMEDGSNRPVKICTAMA